MSGKNYSPSSDRMYKDDDTIVNIADILSSKFNSKAVCFEQLTISSSVKALTLEHYGTSTKAHITVESAQIRFRVDGGNPSSTIGHIVESGDKIILESSEDIVRFKAISTSATSAVLNVTYSI